MIKIENVSTVGWEAAIRGARNPMNSWEKSDSWFVEEYSDHGRRFCAHKIAPGPSNQELFMNPELRELVRADIEHAYEHAKIRTGGNGCIYIGPNDLKLLSNLTKAGSDEAKFRRMIVVYVDITTPLYWWKEADTYKVGTVRNSCSTMHKIHAKEFTLDDFSTEHLIFDEDVPDEEYEDVDRDGWNALNDKYCGYNSSEFVDYNSFFGESLKYTIAFLNRARELYLKTKDKKYWWQMIQLLPSSYNQRATLMLNYEVLANMYHARKFHRLDEWHDFCEWIETLPYAEELITGKQETVEDVLPAQMFSKMAFSKEKWDEIIAGALQRGDLTGIDNTPFQMRKDILEPVSIDKDRVLMKHCEEKAGIIELRKGVSDISIGDALYAHVIIRYDEDHYIKGMAVYSDDIPAGFDVVVNYGPKDPVCVMTNKCAFSANNQRTIKQQFYGNDAKLSPINIIAMEGDLVEEDE